MVAGLLELLGEREAVVVAEAVLVERVRAVGGHEVVEDDVAVLVAGLAQQPGPDGVPDKDLLAVMVADVPRGVHVTGRGQVTNHVAGDRDGDRPAIVVAGERPDRAVGLADVRDDGHVDQVGDLLGQPHARPGVREVAEARVQGRVPGAGSPHVAAPVLHLLAPVEVVDAGVGVVVLQVLAAATWGTAVPEKLLVEDARWTDGAVGRAEHDARVPVQHEGLAALPGLLVVVDGLLDASTVMS